MASNRQRMTAKRFDPLMTRTTAILLASLLVASAPMSIAAVHAADNAIEVAQAPSSGQRGATQKAAPSAASASGEAGLRQRVEQLEEQLVDMQVMIGTLETLARSGGGAAAAGRPVGPVGGPSDGARMDGIETQIRALTAQLEQLAAEVRGQRGERRGEVRGYSTEGSTQFSAASPAAGEPSGPPLSGFGSTTITSTGPDPIGTILSETGPAASPPPHIAAAPLPPAGVGDGADPKQLYETAYGYLLQQDYGAAEVAFDDFLKRYPSDKLAGNAQYWLGESHFVRGDYKSAAGAFLKGYQSYAENAKAPDSLLKLAMSLDRLGQKDAACASFSELNSRFPSAPSHVKNKAQSERKRVGCP